MWFHHQPSGAYESPLDPKPVGYMALRTTTPAGLSDYDNPNDMKNAHGYDINMKNPHGYDVPKGSLVRNAQTNRDMPSKACNDINLINLRYGL